MLEELIVEGLGVIEHAEVSLEGGSSAITGETGAGKTLVVAAVGLLLGDRAEKVLVREGSTQARAQGRFLLAREHPAVELLAARDLVDAETQGDVEVIVTRTVPTQGSATARINGQLVTAAILAEVAPFLVEIAGQHEHGRVSDASWQRATLDAYAGPETVETANRLASHWREASRIRREIDQLTESRRARERELDIVRFEISEIETAEVKAGEEEQLGTDASRLEKAEQIAVGLSGAIEALRGDGGAQDQIARASIEVAPLIATDPVLAELSDRLERAELEVADLAAELSRRVIEPDPSALEATRERLATLGRLKRKYGDTTAEVLSYLDRARARRDDLDTAGEDLERLTEEARELEAAALEEATRLSEARAKAGGRLQDAVSDLLSELAMSGARFAVELNGRELHEGGLETIEFLVAANSGESPRPMSKVASGGELSRIALALHLLTSTAEASTMVFDEVDAGVGGEAAQAVGRSLGQLARSSQRQVVVVTHLPQVAAFADAHYRVVKTDSGARSHAQVQRVRGEERVAELSRMLAGLPESERAQEHAQELLDLASRAEVVA